MIEKVLFALGSVVAFEGFFLAVIPDRLKKTLGQIAVILLKRMRLILGQQKKINYLNL